MAISKKKEKAAEENKALDLKWEVTRANDLSKDDQDGCTIAFDIIINDVKIYGCFYREGKDKNGNDYTMISFPSHKGSDGKYYSYAYVKLTDEQVDAISKDIEKVLNA